jgi:hypothetical protein
MSVNDISMVLVPNLSTPIPDNKGQMTFGMLAAVKSILN